MMSIATGLALTGKVVVTYTIATFATMRPFEQIRTDIASHHASVIVVGTGAGLSYGDDALTHHSLEDIALMRSIPGMTVMCPSDPFETEWATATAVRLKRPVYLRLGKKGEPNLSTKKPRLTMGKARILRNGTDIALLGYGPLVAQVILATDKLVKKNMNPLVASIHTIKPIDQVFIKSLARTFRLIITVEEHSIIGGLGSAVAEILAEEETTTRLVRLGIPDRFVFEIGSQNHLRKNLGLTPDAIADTINVLIQKTT